MGCLKNLFLGILKKILIISAIIAFFALGGWTFTKDKIKTYQNPPKNEFIRTEKNYGDFTYVSADYQLTRSYNFFGYKKVNAKYLPTGQKITIYDLNDKTKLTPQDFNSGEIDKKIEAFLNKTKDSIITFQNFTILEKGSFNAKNKEIPYIKFQADVKNIPFKNVTGVIAAYLTTNTSKKRNSTRTSMFVILHISISYHSLTTSTWRKY